jgi:hypothetical protein
VALYASGVQRLITSTSGITVNGSATFSSSVTATSFSVSNGSLSNNGFWGTLITAGTGSGFDFGLVRSNSDAIMGVPTGTNNVRFSGNVGIGTSVPEAKLTVRGAGVADGTSTFGVILDRGTKIAWTDGGQETTGEYIYSQQGAPYSVSIHSGGYNAIQCPNTGQVYLNPESGNTLVGTTSENSYGSAKSIQINGSGGSLLETRYNGTSGLRVGSGSDHSYHHEPRNVEQRFATNDTTRFYIYGNGNYLFTGTNVSDRRAKENISTLDTYAIDKIMSLEAKKYNMKINPDQNRYGFIAQEVQAIVSDLVIGDENNGYLGLDYDGLLTLTIKALQEQQKEIELLKLKIK